jgi:hypothetical protein
MDSESRQIFWDGYLAARREHFFKEQQVLLGNEFRSNPTFWLEVAEKEWAVVKERLSTGADVSETVQETIGLDFFEGKIVVVSSQTFQLDDEDPDSIILPLYSYEDFVMLANQGIFRETDFILDRERRWQPKVEQLLARHGYERVDVIWRGGGSYLRFVIK